MICGAGEIFLKHNLAVFQKGAGCSCLVVVFCSVCIVDVGIYLNLVKGGVLISVNVAIEGGA